MIRIKRIYERVTKADGCRVLVDRIWPRGVSKEKAKLDRWLKEVAPSTALRKWFDHDPAKWQTFRGKYHKELMEQPEAVAWLRQQDAAGVLTLVFAAKDETHCNAAALKAYLELRED